MERTQCEIITTLSNKKGRISVLKKPLSPSERLQEMKGNKNLNRAKNYIINEGTPVPFLVALGVMSADGKVLSAKYDKFRQINRFLEFIADVVPELEKSGGKIRIADFGSGKSYLTFAVYHFLHNIQMYLYAVSPRQAADHPGEERLQAFIWKVRTPRQRAASSA